MIPERLIKKYKKEILIGILVAFFLSFVELMNYGIAPIFTSMTYGGENSEKVIMLFINLLVLTFVAWLVDKA